MAYPIVLKDAFKRFTLDQDKVLPPEETVRRFKRKLAKLDLDILRERGASTTAGWAFRSTSASAERMPPP